MSPAQALRSSAEKRLLNGGSIATTLNVQFVLGVFRRWWRVVLPCGVVLAAIAAGVVYLTFSPVYKAKAWLRICDNTPFVAFQSREDPRRFLETQMALMRSPLVIGPVVSRPEIAQLPEIRKQETPVDWLGTKINAASVDQSEYVAISFESPSPASSAMVVNAVVDTYLDLRGRDDSEQVQRVIELLEEEKDRRIREVDSMRETIRELAKQATGKDPFARKSRKDTEEPNPLADLQANLIKAEVERQILEARVKAFEESVGRRSRRWTTSDWIGRSKSTQRPEDEGRTDGEEGAAAGIRAHAVARERRIPFTSRWRRKSAATRRPFKRSARLCGKTSAKTSVKSRRAEGKERGGKTPPILEQRLRRRAASPRTGAIAPEKCEGGIGGHPANGVQTGGIGAGRTSVDVDCGAGDQAPNGAAGAVAGNAHARGPTNRSCPCKQSRFNGCRLAGLTGLCLPLLLVVGWEWFARRVCDSEQIELHTRLPVLGEIARLPARSEISPRALSRRSGEHLGLFEESIDGLRTCLALSESLRDMQALAITSASNSEGKTSIAIQLAVSIARASGQAGFADRRRHAIARHPPAAADEARARTGGGSQPPMLGAGRHRDGLEQQRPRHARRKTLRQPAQASRQRRVEGSSGRIAADVPLHRH